MVLTTFATSLEHGKSAGMKTVSEDSYPTEEMIDEFREDAYRLIVKFIGSTTDSDGVAKAMERRMTRPVIMTHRLKIKNPFIEIELTDQIKEELLNAFPDSTGSTVQGISTFIPGENT